jgi:hypothetical protein
MKFYAATLKVPVTLKLIDFSKPPVEPSREFPAGTEVSAVDVNGDGRWHLNYNPAKWETWDGYATTDQLEIGEVIATANEGQQQ